MKTQLPSKYPWKYSREPLGVREPQVENHWYGHRRSQGGPKGPCPPKVFENIVILCFERHFSKQNRVIRLKANILATPIF